MTEDIRQKVLDYLARRREVVDRRLLSRPEPPPEVGFPADVEAGAVGGRDRLERPVAAGDRQTDEDLLAAAGVEAGAYLGLEDGAGDPRLGGGGVDRRRRRAQVVVVLEGLGDDRESVYRFGLDVVTELCERLLAGGAPGLHIYTLNRANTSLALWRRLDG